MNKIEIYTRPVCAYCDRAKQFFVSQGLNFIEHNTATSPDKFIEMLKRSSQRTFPQIFIDDHLVGGFDDLLKLKHAQSLTN